MVISCEKICVLVSNTRPPDLGNLLNWLLSEEFDFHKYILFSFSYINHIEPYSITLTIIKFNLIFQHINHLNKGWVLLYYIILFMDKKRNTVNSFISFLPSLSLSLSLSLSRKIWFEHTSTVADVLFLLIENVLFVCLYGVYRPTHECFTHMVTSPLPVKGCKFWPILGTHCHWTVKVP